MGVGQVSALVSSAIDYYTSLENGPVLGYLFGFRPLFWNHSLGCFMNWGDTIQTSQYVP